MTESPHAPRTRRRWITLGCLALASLGLGTGCQGYRLGPTAGQTAGARTVQIHPFADKTNEPRLIEPVASALRKQVQKDGTLRLTTSERGDVILRGTLVRYERNPLTLQPNDLFSTRDYEVFLTAHVVATDGSTGRVILDRTVTGRVPIRAAADLGSAERQAAPLVAEDLARKVTSLLVDGTW